MATRSSGSSPDLPDSDPLEQLIRRVPFFRSLERVDVARLIGALEEVLLPAGHAIVREGEEADGLYLIESGDVSVTVQTGDGPRSVAQLRGPGYFGELGLLLARRTASVHAVTEVRAWKLPRDRYAQLVRDRPMLGMQVATALAELLDQRSREFIGAPVRQPPPPVTGRPVTSPRWRRRFGLLLAFGVPTLLWPVAAPPGLSTDAWHVLLVLVGAALAWLFEPLPDYVVGLLVVGAWGVTGLAPLSVTFAGFANPSWLVALGALAVAAAMTSSGLMFRMALWLLRVFPPTHTGQVLGLLLSGIVMTPLVPLSVARTAAVAPLSLELGQTMGFPPRSRATAALAFAGLTGYGYFSSVFLTGFASNFFVLGLFPPADQARFGWVTWFVAAAPSGAVMLAGAALSLLLLFRAEVRPTITAEVLTRQRRVLGPLTRAERGTLIALAVLIIGLIVQPLTHINAEWLAIAALAVAFATGALTRDQFRSSIDWGLLVLFGVFFGTGEVLRGNGLDRWIAGSLMGLSGGTTAGGLVLWMTFLVIAVRLIVPRVPAQLLLSLAFVPAAPALGISPWIAGYVVLMVAYTWIIPSQGFDYLLTRELTRGEAFTDRHGLTAGIALTAVRILGIAASISFWRAIGLLAR